MAFCGPCAREQEAYFAIGELIDEEARDFRSEALERMRRVRAGSSAGISADASRSLGRTQDRVSRASVQLTPPTRFRRNPIP